VAIIVESLSRMPIKSSRAEPNVTSLVFSDSGLFNDRMYLFVEAEDHKNIKYSVGKTSPKGHFLSQREDPVMTKVVAEADESGIKLSADGADNLADVNIASVEDAATNLIDVSVWDWHGKAVDQGEVAAQWGTELIGRPVRLVKASSLAPRHVLDDNKKGVVGFADKYPLLITNSASELAVNQMLVDANKPQVPSNRYRSNIVLSGLEAFEEDQIISFSYTDVSGNNVVFERGTPCARCPIPDTDQITGELRRDVRSVLGKNGRRGTYSDPAKAGEKAIFFGVNFLLTKFPETGTEVELPLGAELIATYGEPNWVAN